MFKFNNKDKRTRQWQRSGFVIVNFEHISHLVLVNFGHISHLANAGLDASQPTKACTYYPFCLQKRNVTTCLID